MNSPLVAVPRSRSRGTLESRFFASLRLCVEGLIKSPARRDRPHVLNPFAAIAHQPIVEIDRWIAVTRDETHLLPAVELRFAGELDDAVFIRCTDVACTFDVGHQRHSRIDAVRL